MERRSIWFLVGLFLTTLTTLCLEILDTRLLSVMTWYHLSFFAVSTAMFGMSAGALRVYLAGERFEGRGAVTALGHYGVLYAVAIPVSHILAVQIPIPQGFSIQMAAAMTLLTLTLAMPFYLSGILVAIALTRIPGRIGLVYAVDLIGAALGCVLLVPLLQVTGASSVALLLGALAGVGALCFQIFAGNTGFMARAGTVLLVAVIGTVAWWNPAVGPTRISVPYSKGAILNFSRIQHEAWNVHAQLIAFNMNQNVNPWYWGKGRGAEKFNGTVDWLALKLDGDAGTLMTRWDGSPEGLEWVQYDVTAVPYFLRRGGDAAVIGVGGGRDVLTALWGEHEHVTGIEINQAFLDLLEGEFLLDPERPELGLVRDFAGLADRPDVKLVHDEARSYLTRTTDKYDVLQMSLIDTWAATGAGAFTLSENGLYTVEAWRVFLDVLKPDGLLSVSRWYDKTNASETSRLLALGVASLLETGVADPSQHIALVAQDRVATLLASRQPLSAADVTLLQQVSERFGHTVLVAPGMPPAEPFLGQIVASPSYEALLATVEHPVYDYSPPTDERPYFFNILKPRAAFDVFNLMRLDDSLGVGANVETRGIASGNLVATNTLMVLAGITFLLVLAVILVPLLRSGLPNMSGVSFAVSLAYFAAIGFGFMLVQVPYMQRFSVYLGHPVYAVVVTLFSMILMAGVGSLISDKLPVERRPKLLVLYPLAIAGTLLLQVLFLQSIVEGTIAQGLWVRCAVVVGIVAPLSLLLGFCFPIGLRLVTRISSDATPWMWGVNGAMGVLGAVTAVGISMWAGIHTSLFVALALYAALALLAPLLWSLGRGSELPPPAPARGTAATLPVVGEVGSA